MKGGASQKEVAVVLQPARKMHTVRVVGLSTLSPRMLPPIGPYVVRLTPAQSLTELRAVLNKHLQEIDAKDVEWIHFIRHRRTLNVLRKEFPELPLEPNRFSYRYVPGDIMMMAVLKRRPHPCLPPTPEDFIYWVATAELQATLIPRL